MENRKCAATESGHALLSIFNFRLSVFNCAHSAYKSRLMGMETLSYIRKIGARCLGGVLCMLMLTACDSVIYDYEGDCSVTYRLKFRYDWNMAFADAFAREVETVTLYVLDSEGRIVWRKTEEGEALAAEDYAMTVDVEPGTYDLLAWCGTRERGSFDVPDTGHREGLTCTLRREHDEDGNAYCDRDLDRLFHGYVRGQVFCSREGVHTYEVPLMKNTNNIRVVLQHLSGEAIDKGQFEFSITDDNGTMDWNNAVLPDEPVTYYAWREDAGKAEFAEDAPEEGVLSSLSAVIAELTVPRLMTDHADRARLVIRNRENGETVVSIPLIDAVLLVKGYYNREMSDQEYLDRQDVFSLTFFLDEDNRWMDAYIYINSWKVVLQDAEL